MPPTSTRPSRAPESRSARGVRREGGPGVTGIGVALRTYLDHLAVERGLAANTLSSYRRDLRRYHAFLDTSGVSDLDAVTEATVSAFLMHLREGDTEHPPLSATSAGRTVVAGPRFARGWGG